MDEDVHVSQAQWYCINIFDQYDETLTTPPGLYLISVGVLGPLSKFMDGFLCQVWHLRMTNVAFAAGNLYLLNAITRKLHPNSSAVAVSWTALNLACLPVLYFFTFMYYTDVGSTFFVLFAYLHRLYRKEAMAAVFGAISVLFRQTNIVWVFFMACETSLEVLYSELPTEKVADEDICRGSTEYLLRAMRTITLLPFRQKKIFAVILKKILYRCSLYLSVGLAFLYYVYWNGGVVIGDKSGHPVTAHFPQVMYLLGFILVFSASYLLTRSELLQFVQYCRCRTGQTIAWLLFMGFILRVFAFDHPYLVDYRHMGVQVWRKFMGKEGIRYCFVPLYYYSGWSLLNSLRTLDALRKFFLIICLTLSVSLDPLIEFRYFILPYLIVRLHLNLGSYIQLVFETIITAFVNIYMFYWFMEPEYEKDFVISRRFYW